MFKNNELNAYLSPHTETTDSEDFNDLYQSSIEKHSDSIIPTKQAYELQSRKTSTTKQSKSELNKSLFSTFQSQATQKLQQILLSYKTSVSLLSTPPLHQSLSSELQQKERALRETLKKEQDSRLTKLKKLYDDKKVKIIEEKRDSLQKFWRGKVFALNGKLQEAEWKRNTKQSEDEERIKHVYEKAYKEALKTDAIELEKEIEEHFNRQLQEKLAEMTPKSNYRDEEDLREAVNDMHEVLKIQERVKWDGEKKKIRELCEERLKKEQESEIVKAEEELRMKWSKIESERLEEAKNEIKQKWLQQEKTENNKESVKNKEAEWEAQALQEFNENLIEQYRQELAPGIEKDLKKSLASVTEVRILKLDQELLFRQVGEDLSTSYECFKKEAEIFFKKQKKLSEDSIKNSLSEKLETKTKEKLTQVEKEAYIKYLQKLEKQKQTIKKTFEDKEGTELKVMTIQKLKDVLLKEKQNLGQLKAKNNLQIGKLDEDIKKYLAKLEEDSIRLDMKMRELNIKKRQESRLSRPNKIISKTPSRPIINSSALSPELLKFTPSELLPYCTSVKGIHLNFDTSTKINSPDIERSPKNMHTQYNSKVLFKDCNLKSLSYDNFKFHSKDVLNSAKLKQSVYHELLKEKFGYIEPRLK